MPATKKKQMDRIVHLSNGAKISYEEKLRHTSHTDILVEYWSNYESGIPGWAVKKDIASNRLIYAIPARNLIYVADWDKFQHAAKTLEWHYNDMASVSHFNRRVWKYARNVGHDGAIYHTVSAAVSFEKLRSLCGMEKHIVPTQQQQLQPNLL